MFPKVVDDSRERGETDMSNEGLTTAEYEQMKADQANARATLAKHGADSFVQALKDECDFPPQSGTVK